MSTVLVPSLQVKRRITLRKRRELPIAGSIRFAVGQSVSESDIVADAQLPGEMRIIRVAEDLGIEPHEVAETLKVQQGDKVAVGQVIAERRAFFGLFCSRVISPLGGIIELVSNETGHIGVRAASVPLQVKAYLRGKVVEVVQNRSLVIEESVSFIQGIFGIGGERSGVIRILPIAPEEELHESHLQGAKAGEILVGGCRPSAAVLRLAAERGVVGVVVGSLDDKTLSEYLGYELGIALTGDEDIPLTVIMTEGFGSLPIAPHTLSLLKELDGCHASINGATQVRAGALRPEIVVFSDIAKNSECHEERVEMKVGVRVRVIRVPYFGMYGDIVELPQELEQLGTGGKARVLKVRLSTGEVVVVPRANIELMS